MKINSFIKTNAVAIAALLFAGCVMSFKVAEKKVAPITYYYVYSGMAAGDFAAPGHWQTADPGDCDTDGLKPCKIIVKDGQTLSGVLSGKDNNGVLSISLGRRP